MHLRHPVYGSRKLTVLLHRDGMAINRKRVVRLLRLMGIEAIYAKPKTSQAEAGHQIYPYLLRDLEVTGPDQVWCSDITYVPMATGFMYLVAVMDWWSRYVLGCPARMNTFSGLAAASLAAPGIRPRTHAMIMNFTLCPMFLMAFLSLCCLKYPYSGINVR
jgi:transposase InsO family protein